MKTTPQLKLGVSVRKKYFVFNLENIFLIIYIFWEDISNVQTPESTTYWVLCYALPKMGEMNTNMNIFVNSDLVDLWQMNIHTWKKYILR